jgi:hypothetical protein
MTTMNLECNLTGRPGIIWIPAHLGFVINSQLSKPARWKPHRDGYILDVVSDPLRYNRLAGIYYN